MFRASFETGIVQWLLYNAQTLLKNANFDSWLYVYKIYYICIY